MQKKNSIYILKVKREGDDYLVQEIIGKFWDFQIALKVLSRIVFGGEEYHVLSEGKALIYRRVEVYGLYLSEEADTRNLSYRMV